jgi:hypothetical protein
MTGPFAQRKRNSIPLEKWGIFLAAMALVGMGVWVLVVKAIPILREKEKEKAPLPVSAHESRDFNYRLILPKSPWDQDTQVRIGLKANLLAMRRTNPTGWFALAARDYKTRNPRDTEAFDEAVSRLDGYFKNLEWEPATDGTLAGRKAGRLIFQGSADGSTMEGECYILIYRGIAYWFITWAPLTDAPQLKEEFRQIREGFSLLKEREGWTEKAKG